MPRTMMPGGEPSNSRASNLRDAHASIRSRNRANVIRLSSRSETIFSSGYPLFYYRRRIDFCDPAQAVRFGRMRARDEGSTDFGRVPAGLDAETKRFFRHDVTWREILHQELSVYAVRPWSGRLDEMYSSFRQNIVLFRSRRSRAE